MWCHECSASHMTSASSTHLSLVTDSHAGFLGLWLQVPMSPGVKLLWSGGVVFSKLSFKIIWFKTLEVFFFYLYFTTVLSISFTALTNKYSSFILIRCYKCIDFFRCSIFPCLVLKSSLFISLSMCWKSMCFMEKKKKSVRNAIECWGRQSHSVIN